MLEDRIIKSVTEVCGPKLTTAPNAGLQHVARQDLQEPTAAQETPAGVRKQTSWRTFCTLFELSAAQQGSLHDYVNMRQVMVHITPYTQVVVAMQIPRIKPFWQCKTGCLAKAGTNCKYRISYCVVRSGSDLVKVFTLEPRGDLEPDVTFMQVLQAFDVSCEEASAQGAVWNNGNAQLSACWYHLILQHSQHTNLHCPPQPPPLSALSDWMCTICNDSAWLTDEDDWVED